MSPTRVPCSVCLTAFAPGEPAVFDLNWGGPTCERCADALADLEAGLGPDSPHLEPDP